MKRPELKSVVRVFVIIALVLPIFVYIYNFGWRIQNNHQGWGEFGSFMSGIYSPILSLLTLAVLVFQVRLQREAQQHQRDYDFLAHDLQNIDFHLMRLEKALSSAHSSGGSVIEVLKKNFCYRHEDLLSNVVARRLASDLVKEHQVLFDAWTGIYPILTGMRVPRRFPYEHTELAARQRIISVVSFAACVALDNMHWALTEGRAGVKYIFSSEVPKDVQVS